MTLNKTKTKYKGRSEGTTDESAPCSFFFLVRRWRGVRHNYAMAVLRAAIRRDKKENGNAESVEHAIVATKREREEIREEEEGKVSAPLFFRCYGGSKVCRS